MFIGRAHERELVQIHIADMSKAQMVVLYGRRRVGKSTLIRESLKKERNVLFFEGIQGAETSVQIEQFLNDFSKQTGRVKLAATNWRDAFQGLGEFIASDRWVLVFDEFPWMAAGRSQIVSDLKLFWDRFTYRNPKIAIFLCGSVASFMVKHIVHSKALHNRKTLEICLGPLTPKEAGRFISQRGLAEKAQLYMCLGGVPKYLEQLDPKISFEKNMNRLCFSKNGFFVNEFETLFKEQFRSVKFYELITKCLAQSPMTLAQLADRTGIAKGGGLHDYLQNLVRAQFVRDYAPVALTNQKRLRTKVYKLVDPFLIFYFRYINPQKNLIERNVDENLFHAITHASIDQYYGFAFERLCEDAMSIIMNKLGITLSDVVNMGPFFQQSRGPHTGVQVDWLILRRDDVWTLLEYKYHNKVVGSGVIKEIEQKISRMLVPAHITIEKVLVTNVGVSDGVGQSKFFNKILTLSDVLE